MVACREKDGGKTDENRLNPAGLLELDRDS